MAPSEIIVFDIEKRYRTINKQPKEFHWVLYANKANAQNAQTWERIDRMDPAKLEEKYGDDESLSQRDPTGTKRMHMKYVYEQIKPYYDAWARGETVEVDGTPLSAWAHLNKQQVAVFKKAGIVTVEEIAQMVDNQMRNVQLPDLKLIKKTAQQYIENQDTAATSAELAETREELTAAKALMVEMQQNMANLQEQLNAQKPKKAKAA